MASIKDVLAYIITKYPYESELSKARLTKLVYLSDWESSVSRGKSITDLEWYFNHYGPYIDEIVIPR